MRSIKLLVAHVAGLAASAMTIGCAATPDDAVTLAGDLGEDKADGILGKTVTARITDLMWSRASLHAAADGAPAAEAMLHVGLTSVEAVTEASITYRGVAIAVDFEERADLWISDVPVPRVGNARFFLYAWDGGFSVLPPSDWDASEWRRVDCTNAEGQHTNFFNGVSVDLESETLTTFGGARFSFDACGIDDPRRFAIFAFPANDPQGLSGEYMYRLDGDCGVDGCWSY